MRTRTCGPRTSRTRLGTCKLVLEEVNGPRGSQSLSWRTTTLETSMFFVDLIETMTKSGSNENKLVLATKRKLWRQFIALTKIKLKFMNFSRHTKTIKYIKEVTKKLIELLSKDNCLIFMNYVYISWVVFVSLGVGSVWFFCVSLLWLLQ